MSFRERYRFCSGILPTLDQVTLGANNPADQLLPSPPEDFLECATSQDVRPSSGRT
jgi:hypothetical protein